MVKKTVNFDDPSTYHLYYGDDHGTPGTLLTHFPRPNATLGVHGSPEIVETRLRIPSGSLNRWTERLAAQDVAASLIEDAGAPRLEFSDHDGMRFSLIEDDVAAADDALLGIAGVVIHVPDPDDTGGFLQRVLGFEEAKGPVDVTRLVLGDGRPGQRLELRRAPADPVTAMGAGTVHHVAWRVPDEDAQASVSRAVSEAGIAVTPVLDRQYFRSIYFRVPGGVIFEVATDGPGFAVDEPLGSLGTSLKLPPQHEHRRDGITAALVPLV